MDITSCTILLPSHVGIVPLPQVMELMSSVLEVSVPEIRETVKRDRCDWLAAIFNLLLDYPDGRLSLQKMLSDEQSQSVGSSQESLNGVSGFSQGLSQGTYVCGPLYLTHFCLLSTVCVSVYCLCSPLSTVCVSVYCLCVCLLSVCLSTCLFPVCSVVNSLSTCLCLSDRITYS